MRYEVSYLFRGKGDRLVYCRTDNKSDVELALAYIASGTHMTDPEVKDRDAEPAT